WADEHHKKTGKWPSAISGTIPAAPEENWGAINAALISGLRGLQAGSSIPELLQEERGVRNLSNLPKLTTKIIGLTGSNGKTSTKDMLATLLNEKYKVNKTESNNNNHIGVPLTLLATNEKHDVLIAELGTNHFGEIEYTAKILQPDFALIINIGDSHLEHLKNREGVLKEKIALFDETQNNKGKVFINYDDPLLKNLDNKFNNCTTYGFKNNVEVKGKILNYTDDGRPVVEIKYKNRKMKNTLSLYGEQSAKNYLAAVSVALNLGLTKEQIKKGTKKLI
ncbi:MAG: hypothetical protein IIB07_06770, partial [Bacteroidetes bacterium]|nr:hypothetical protein [Bacteroidota bacterium]